MDLPAGWSSIKEIQTAVVLPVLVGALINCAAGTVVASLAFSYFRQHRKDRLLNRIFVAIALILNWADTVLLSRWCLEVCLERDPHKMVRMPWELGAIVVTTVSSIFLSTLFHMSRLWVGSLQQARPLISFCAIASVIAYALGIHLAVVTFQSDLLEEFLHPYSWSFAYFGLIASVDFSLMAGTYYWFVYIRQKNNVGMSTGNSSNSRITFLAFFYLRTNMTATLLQVIQAILIFTTQGALRVCLAFLWVKLYSFSIIAALLARQSPATAKTSYPVALPPTTQALADLAREVKLRFPRPLVGLVPKSLFAKDRRKQEKRQDISLCVTVDVAVCSERSFDDDDAAAPQTFEMKDSSPRRPSLAYSASALRRHTSTIPGSPPGRVPHLAPNGYALSTTSAFSTEAHVRSIIAPWAEDGEIGEAIADEEQREQRPRLTWADAEKRIGDLV